MAKDKTMKWQIKYSNKTKKNHGQSNRMANNKITKWH